MCGSVRFALLCSVPLLTSTAWANDGAIFSGLGIPGDGVTPSLMDELVAKGATAPSPAHVGSASAGGDFGYSVGIDLPPALFSPSLSVSYSSSSSGDGWVGRGWSIGTGMQITELSPRELATSYAGRSDILRVSGGGLSGLLEPIDNTVNESGFVLYRYIAADTAHATADYEEATGEWTVYVGSNAYTLKHRLTDEFGNTGRSWIAVERNRCAVAVVGSAPLC